jgi:hypothetical protein
MVQECTTSYEARRQTDGSVEISISVPPQFADLWLVKLTQLETDDEEIRRYRPSSR